MNISKNNKIHSVAHSRQRVLKYDISRQKKDAQKTSKTALQYAVGTISKNEKLEIFGAKKSMLQISIQFLQTAENKIVTEYAFFIHPKNEQKKQCVKMNKTLKMWCDNEQYPSKRMLKPTILG